VARRARPRAALSTRLALVVGACLLALVIAEAWARWSRTALVRVNAGLRFQVVDIEVFEPSDDFMLFRHRPGATLQGRRNSGQPYTVNINGLGARGAESSKQPDEDGLRILFMGGSTVYGHALGDGQTIPACLQDQLGQRVPGVEVLNFGAPSYVTSQMATLAAEKLVDLQADLVLVLLTNIGPRNFLGPALEDTPETIQVLRGDPWLSLEYYPVPTWLTGAHRAGIHHSGLYRYLRGGLVGAPGPNHWTRRVAQERVRVLEGVAAERGVPVVYLLHPWEPRHSDEKVGSRGEELPPELDPGRVVDLLPYFPANPPPVYELHPRAERVPLYAQAVAGALFDGGWLADPDQR